MSIRTLVLKEIRAVAAEQEKTLPPLTDDLHSWNPVSTRFASPFW